MKKILLFAGLILAGVCHGQIKQNYPQYGGQWKRLSASVGLQLPLVSTGSSDLNAGPMLGDIRYDTGDGYIYLWDGTVWVKFAKYTDVSTGAITALTGDGTATGPGSVPFTLATVNSNAGTFGSATQVAQLTVNGKGLVTSVTAVTVTPAWGSITGIPSNLVTGTGTANQVTYWSGTNAITGHANYTFTPGSNPALLIKGNNGGGFYIGSNTAVSTYGSIYSAGVTPGAANFAMSSDGASSYLNGTTTAVLSQNGSSKVAVTSTDVTLYDDLLFVTDNNFDIGAAAATRPRNVYIASALAVGTTLTLATNPTTSAGGYDLITRNTSTGVIEKVATSVFQTAGNYITALTGDGTATGPGSAAFTLAAVNSSPGTYGSATQVAQITVNAKGLATTVANVTITPAWGSITGVPTTLAGYGITLASGNIWIGNGSNAATAVTPSGDWTISTAGVATLASVVSASSCTNCNITYDAKGRITTATSGSSGITVNTTAITSGTDTRVFFQDGSVISQDAGFTYNKTTDFLTLGGGILAANGSAATPSINFSSDPDNGMYLGAANSLSIAVGGGETIRMATTNTWFKTAFVYLGASADLVLNRDAAAVLELGADAGSVTPQTLKAQDATGTNIAGSIMNVAGGRGTGTGIGGSVVIQVAPAGSTGSSQNTLASAVTVASTKAVQFNGYGSGTYTGTATKSLQVDASGNIIEGTLTTGTVTAITIATANGFAGSSSGGATPALTLSTTVTGILKGNGTAISAATVRTDYGEPTNGLATGILKNTTGTGQHTIAVAGTDYIATMPSLTQVATVDGTSTVPIAIANYIDLQQAVYLTGDITPTQLTADVNNYNPTNLSTNATLRLSSDATRTITGLQGNVDGAILFLHNVGSFNIILANQSASSTAAYRFALSGDITIGPNQTAFMRYDATSTRWRVLSEHTTSAGAYVVSVSGTTNRITSTGGVNPVIDISASYVGQTSITTLGTIATGTWQGTSISTTYTDAKIKTVTGGASITIGGTSTDPTFAVNTSWTGQTAITTLGTITTGTWNGTAIAATYGGTGNTTYAIGDILYASNTNALSRLADVATGNALISGGIGAAPSWGKIALTTHVSGTLPVANGGTGLTAVGSALQVLRTNAGATGMEWATISAGTGTVTNTGGNLTSNSVVLGAGTVDTKVVAGITTDGVSVINLGVNATTIGKIKFFGNTSGDATIQPAAVAGTATVLTLPAATATLATLALAETFTNKTLTASSNVLGGVTMTLSSDASYDIYYRNSSGVLTRLGMGTTGQYLSANTTAAPTWATPAGTVTGGNNGLSLSGANIQLGGSALTGNSTISTSAYSLTINSSNAAKTLGLVNSSTGAALNATNTGTGAGGYIGASSQPLQLDVTSGNSSGNDDALLIQKSGTTSTGVSATIRFDIGTTSGSGNFGTNKIVSKWHDATNASRSSTMIFSGVGNTSNIDILSLKAISSTGSQSTFTGQVGSALYTQTYASTTAFDFNNGNNQIVTLTGNPTITFSNMIQGFRYLIWLKQDGTGSRTVGTWPTIKWPLATAPTLSTAAGKYDAIYVTLVGSDVLGEYSIGF